MLADAVSFSLAVFFYNKIMNNYKNIQNYCASQYRLNLNHNLGVEARQYLDNRAISPKMIDLFGLGYATMSWDFITKTLIDRGFPVCVLEDSGMTIVKVNDDCITRCFDRFRNRIMFPIHNEEGLTVGFGSRIFAKTNPTDKYQPPKYLNSPETEIYHKSQVLYGIFQAKEEIKKMDFCYLVEGYFDVILMHDAGLQNTVGSCGTSLTIEQIKLIKKFTNNIILIYDGDSAGVKASIKAIDLILSMGCSVELIKLNEKDDPDSVIRKMGIVDFQKFIGKNKLSFIDYTIQNLLKDGINKSVYDKIEVFKKIINNISNIKNPSKQFDYLQELCSIFKFKMEIAFLELNKILLARQHKRRQPF